MFQFILFSCLNQAKQMPQWRFETRVKCATITASVNDDKRRDFFLTGHLAQTVQTWDLRWRSIAGNVSLLLHQNPHYTQDGGRRKKKHLASGHRHSLWCKTAKEGSEENRGEQERMPVVLLTVYLDFSLAGKTKANCANKHGSGPFYHTLLYFFKVKLLFSVSIIHFKRAVPHSASFCPHCILPPSVHTAISGDGVTLSGSRDQHINATSKCMLGGWQSQKLDDKKYQCYCSQFQISSVGTFDRNRMHKNA